MSGTTSLSNASGVVHCSSMSRSSSDRTRGTTSASAAAMVGHGSSAGANPCSDRSIQRGTAAAIASANAVACSCTAVRIRALSVFEGIVYHCVCVDAARPCKPTLEVDARTMEGDLDAGPLLVTVADYARMVGDADEVKR